MLLLTIVLGLLLSPSILIAQPELRMEKTNLPPAVGTLVRAGGKVFHRSYMGLHVLETSTQSWRYLGEGSRHFADGDWIVHPDGNVVVATGSGIIEFDAVAETVERYNNVWYQVRLSDSLVADIDVEYKADTTIMRMVWFRWPSMDTARVDVVPIIADRGYKSPIPSSNGYIIAVTSSAVIRFHYDRQTEVIKLLEKIASDVYNVYSDAERTHIILNGASSLVYSTDLFETYSYFSSSLIQSRQQVRLSADPEAIYVASNNNLVRVNRNQTQFDTLRSSQGSSLANFEVLQDTVILGVTDSVLVFNNDRVLVANSGLPSRSFANLAYFPGGMIATTASEVVAHPSGGEWSLLPLNEQGALIGYSGVIFPMGGNSIDDFWLVARDTAFHINPRPLIEKVSFGYNGYVARGVHTRSGQSHFTMLSAMEESCGSNQVVMISGFETLRTLLCTEGLRSLMVFNNKDHVALTRDGIAWRTVDGDVDRWEQINIPVIGPNDLPRTTVNGEHGLVRTQSFMMWTHDAGRTWKSVEGVVSHSTITADGTIYTVRRTHMPDSAFIVERRIDDVVTTVAVYDTSVHSSIPNELRSVAHDEDEQRLYIATTEWTASLVIPVSSVHESSDLNLRPSDLHYGMYDMFGRFVCQDEQAIVTSGLYLRVDSYGVRKVMVVR